MSLKKKWTKEDATYFLAFTTSADPTRAPIAVVAKTWSPTRSSAGWTARIDHHPSGPKTLGEHFDSVREAKLAVVEYLASKEAEEGLTEEGLKKSSVEIDREIAQALAKSPR